MKQFSHWDYCEFLLASHGNYTQTYFAEHSDEISHDRINRLMREQKLSPKEVRQYVSESMVLSENGYVLFDDTVIDKSHSFAIEMVRRQWSGNAKGVIKGIGVVTCVYVNPDIDQFWIIDYRIFDPERDGRSKIAHLLEMWRTLVHGDALPFRTVLMDSWYATTQVMKTIEAASKIYYCPLKANRQVSQQVGDAYARVDALFWNETERAHGKLVHVKKFPKGHQLKLFRLVVSTHRTDFVVTNDLSQDSAPAARNESARRWKIEQFHREAKQLTGLESSQCRLQRAQRNHIACAMLVWVRLHQIASQAQVSLYQVKQGLLHDYMRQQLRNPTYSMNSA